MKFELPEEVICQILRQSPDASLSQQAEVRLLLEDASFRLGCKDLNKTCAFAKGTLTKQIQKCTSVHVFVKPPKRFNSVIAILRWIRTFKAGQHVDLKLIDNYNKENNSCVYLLRTCIPMSLTQTYEYEWLFMMKAYLGVCQVDELVV